MKKIFLLVAALPALAFAQINLKVLDENGAPVPETSVSYNSQTFTTDANGFLKIPVADSEQI